MRPRHEGGTPRRLPAPYDEMLITYATALADTVGAVRTAHAYHGQLNAHYAPRTVNNVLAAIEDFYTHLHLGATGIPRERAADATRTGSPPE